MSTAQVLAVLPPLWLTLKVATVGTALSLVVGVTLAALLTHNRVPGRDYLDALFTLPLVLPPTVLGYYLIVVVGKNGWLGRWLFDTFGISLIFTWQGAALAAALVALPLIFKSARAAFSEVDRNLLKAARTLGATEMRVFFRVTFPLAWRGVLAGVMLAFARSLGEFGATLMVAGNLPGKTQTLSLAIYEAVQAGNDGWAAALVLLTSLLCATLLIGGAKALRTNYLKEMER